MKATKIKTEGQAAWDAEHGPRRTNAGIAKVLQTPGSIGSTTFLVIDADGYLVKGTAANYHNTQGIIAALYECNSLYEAASEMRERHYRHIIYINPYLEDAA